MSYYKKWVCTRTKKRNVKNGENDNTKGNMEDSHSIGKKNLINQYIVQNQKLRGMDFLERCKKPDCNGCLLQTEIENHDGSIEE